MSCNHFLWARIQENTTIENTIHVKLEQSSRDEQQVVLAQDTLLKPFVVPQGACMSWGNCDCEAWSVCVCACHLFKLCGKVWHLLISHHCNWHATVSSDLISGRESNPRTKRQPIKCACQYTTVLNGLIYFSVMLSFNLGTISPYFVHNPHIFDITAD